MLIVHIEDGPGKALHLGLLPRRPFQRRENWGGSWSTEQAGKSLRLIICLLPLQEPAGENRNEGTQAGKAFPNSHQMPKKIVLFLSVSPLGSACGTPRGFSKDLLHWLLPWAQNSVWVGKKSCCSGKTAKRRRKTETQGEEVRLCWGNGPERRGQLAASNNHFWDSH